MLCIALCLNAFTLRTWSRQNLVCLIVKQNSNQIRSLIVCFYFRWFRLLYWYYYFYFLLQFLMLFIRRQINRQSLDDVFYFVYFLFLLHICTAFLTIINGVNNNSNENEGSFSIFCYLKMNIQMNIFLATIQFSMDSIHAVESSDPHVEVEFIVILSIFFKLYF